MTVVNHEFYEQMWIEHDTKLLTPIVLALGLDPKKSGVDDVNREIRVLRSKLRTAERRAQQERRKKEHAEHEVNELHGIIRGPE